MQNLKGVDDSQFAPTSLYLGLIYLLYLIWIVSL